MCIPIFRLAAGNAYLRVRALRRIPETIEATILDVTVEKAFKRATDRAGRLISIERTASRNGKPADFSACCSPTLLHGRAAKILA